MDIKSYDDFINEAMTPEERRAKRKARRESNKVQKSKPATSMDADDDIYDMDEIDAKPSKSMTQAAERYRTEMVKLQDLQKEFVTTDKDNIAKRETLKKKLIAQSKIAKAAEADFERMVAAEEPDYVEDMFYDSHNSSFSISSAILESVSGASIRRMEGLVPQKAMKAFLLAADQIMEALYRDEDFDYEDVLEFLAIKIESMHPSD